MGVYFIKQKMLSATDDFSVLDEKKQPKFVVKGNIIGKKKLTIYSDKTEVGHVKEQEFLGHVSYDIIIGGKKVANMKTKKNDKRAEFKVSGTGWSIKGNVWDEGFKINKFLETIATIKKEAFSMTDSYKIKVAKDENDLMVIALVLAIDAIMYEQ